MRRNLFRTTSLALAGLAVWLSIPTVSAQPVVPGDLIIYRVGDGAAALSTAAAAVFLDEYTPAGTFVRSITVPSTGSSAQTATGNSTTEGIISRSQDGSHLIFTGYRADA